MRAGTGLDRWIPLLSAGLLALVWQGSAWLAARPRWLPPLDDVLVRLGEEIASGDLFHHLGATLLRVAAAFMIAMTVGTFIGIVMGRSRSADLWGQPWLLFFLNLPALVLIVLAYIWIGLNETAAILAVSLNKIPNVAVMLREGTRALDRQLLQMAKVYRFGRGKTLRHVVLPQLYPYLSASARSGLALIWKIVLVVELLGRSNGVGFQIGLYFQLFDVASILAYALAFILIVQAIEWGLLQPLERRLNGWRTLP
ncbi:MAG: ABC transporter permease [Geminicoccaceae bacterium]